jgi:hypothetical protein
MTMNYSEAVDLTASSAAPPSRLAAGPAESAAWSHQVAEAEQAISQMSGPDLGAHQTAVTTAGPYSVADEVLVMRPSSPGQLATLDGLTQVREGEGQGQ